MSSKPILYHIKLGPPSRSTLLTIAALNIDVELKEMKTSASEHLQPDFVKVKHNHEFILHRNNGKFRFHSQINPQHTLPFLQDGDVAIADSHAICMYLCDKYATDDTLYPKDLGKRALVNSRLHFNSGHMFCQVRALFETVFKYKSPVLPQPKVDVVREQWEIFEGFLQDGLYLCGDELTIADLCCITSVSSVNEVVPIDADKFPKLVEWIDRLAQLPYYEENNGAAGRTLQANVRRVRQQNENAQKND